MRSQYKLKYFLVMLLVSFSACKSRKSVLSDNTSEVVKTAPSLSLKYADLMGVGKKDITNGRLYSFIDDWVGTPYQFGGLSKAGIDCSGFVSLLQQQVYGVNIPRITSQQVTVIKRKFENELQEGDLIFWDYDGKKFSHVGVYLQNDYVVHASTRKGVIIVKLHDPSTYKYFSRCGSVMAAAN